MDSTINHFHLFCGLGGGAAGFNRGHARVGSTTATFRCIGGVDNDPAAIADFDRITGSTGTVMDLFDRDQYILWHGQEPPAGWKEATPEDVRKAAGNRKPNIVFTSSPCKGFSGLLSQAKSTTPKYQALNRLTLRGIWLSLEAWKDDPPEFFIFENVPRIATRGRHLLDQIVALLRSYGYATAETTHDCGELGALAQSRRRFLLVARHMEQVPPFLYEPDHKPLKSVGSILGRMALPGDPAAGPLHRVPRLHWKTWVRLAFVEAGSDWRSLNRLRVEDGYLQDYLIVPEYRGGFLGVKGWNEAMGTVAGRSTPTNGTFSVADPRFAGHQYQQYGIRRWEDSSGAVSGQSAPGGGAYSVADPRPGMKANTYQNIYRVVRWDENCKTVVGASHVAGGAMSVADPRQKKDGFGKYAVTPWNEKTGTVLSSSTTGQSAFAVADPRPAMSRGRGDHYLTGGHYGVVPWQGQSYAVAGAASHDNGHWSVADPRLPAAAEQGVFIIQAEDDTWHRPFTTLELAALQGLVEPEEYLELNGLSDSSWRERIGNAVPPPAAEAIASVMGTTILLARAGETFSLSNAPIWVKPMAIAVSLSEGDRVRHED